MVKWFIFRQSIQSYYASTITSWICIRCLEKVPKIFSRMLVSWWFFHLIESVKISQKNTNRRSEFLYKYRDISHLQGFHLYWQRNPTKSFDVFLSDSRNQQGEGPLQRFSHRARLPWWSGRWKLWEASGMPMKGIRTGPSVLDSLPEN